MLNRVALWVIFYPQQAWARIATGPDRRSRRSLRYLVDRQVARLIQVALTSVYFSNACSDLSRPLPDCL